MLCGGHQTPIRGRYAPHDDVQSQVLTNLLHEVDASNIYAACNLSTPEVPSGAYRTQKLKTFISSPSLLGLRHYSPPR